MNKVLLALLFVSMLATISLGQKVPKSWAEWDKKDAEKMLNGSAWGQTQDNTDTSEMMFTPTANDTTSQNTTQMSRDRQESGAKNGAISMKYRVRFFSAKPIREAFARMIVLQKAANDASMVRDLSGKMQPWIDADLGDIVVVAVSIESQDRRLSGPAEQAFRSATSETLKPKCYLERNDGKRVYLEQFEQPTADQTGAKFVFPRTLDGQPFLTTANETVRFVAEFDEKTKIITKYKIADMVYNGKLEY